VPNTSTNAAEEADEASLDFEQELLAAEAAAQAAAPPHLRQQASAEQAGADDDPAAEDFEAGGGAANTTAPPQAATEDLAASLPAPQPAPAADGWSGVIVGSTPSSETATGMRAAHTATTRSSLSFGHDDDEPANGGEAGVIGGEGPLSPSGETGQDSVSCKERGKAVGGAL